MEPPAMVWLSQWCTYHLPAHHPPSFSMTHAACSFPPLTVLFPPMSSTPPAAWSQGSTGTPPLPPPSVSPLPMVPLPCTPWVLQVEMLGGPTVTLCHLPQASLLSLGVPNGSRWWLSKRQESHLGNWTPLECNEHCNCPFSVQTEPERGKELAGAKQS